MPLGSNLETDLQTALANSDNATTSSNNLATAINNYLGDADYAYTNTEEDEGAIVYSSSVAGSTFLLPVPGTASDAAQQWADGVQGYWGTGVVTGAAIFGTPQNGGTAVDSATITATTVSTTLKPLLETIFNNVGGTQSSKASDIAGAIETAVATIVTAHTETNPSPPPTSLGPFAGGIE